MDVPFYDWYSDSSERGGGGNTPSVTPKRVSTDVQSVDTAGYANALTVSEFFEQKNSLTEVTVLNGTLVAHCIIVASSMCVIVKDDDGQQLCLWCVCVRSELPTLQNYFDAWYGKVVGVQLCPTTYAVKTLKFDACIVTIGLKGELSYLNPQTSFPSFKTKTKNIPIEHQSTQQEYQSKPSLSQQRAREIMGKNYFGIEEAIKYYGVKPTKEQLAILDKVPWSEEVLKSCKKTHILIAVFPLSILDVRDLTTGFDTSNYRLFDNQDWYNDHEFARDKGKISWKLVRRESLGVGKSWNVQQTLLPKEEEIPVAQIMVYTIIGHFLATGERLSREVYARCNDVMSKGYRIYVGNFRQTGLFIDAWYGHQCADIIGFAATRKHFKFRYF